MVHLQPGIRYLRYYYSFMMHDSDLLLWVVGGHDRQRFNCRPGVFLFHPSVFSLLSSFDFFRSNCFFALAFVSKDIFFNFVCYLFLLYFMDYFIYIYFHLLFFTGRPGGQRSGSPRMLLVLVREFESRRGQILNLFAKIKKGSTAESA